MGSTFSYNHLPPSTTASIAKMIDRRETAYLQEFIREYLDSKKSN